MWPHRALLLLALLAAVPFPVRGNADGIDFARVTPVPDDQPVPIQDFFRPPLFSNPVLNSAGTHFAARVESGNDQIALLVGDLATLKLRVFTNYKDEDVDWFTWLDDTRLLTNRVGEKRYPRGLYVTEINDAYTYPLARYSAIALVGVPAKAPTKPLLWVYRNANDEGKDLGVIQVDAEKRLGEYEHPVPGSFQDSVARDEAKLHGIRAPVIGSYPTPPGDPLVVNYLADRYGELAFALTASRGAYTLFRFTGQKWEKSPVKLDLFHPLAAGDRNDEVIVLGPRQEGRPRALHRLDAASGQLGELLTQDNNYDLTTATFYRHPVTRAILGVKYYRNTLHTVWFDAGYAAVQKMLADRFSGLVVNLLGSDGAGNRFFFSTHSDRQPLSYYLLDRQTQVITLVRNSAPWLDPARMRPTSLIRVRTRDGFQLDGYLTLPARAPGASPPPVVVLPHGGPHLRDAWGFNGEVQFLASRGYAVLQVNYRGSTGYAWMFPAADLWNFRKMHDDVTDAGFMLGKTGLVDSTRMAIMGTSFGGYLAMCGAAFEPDRYRCAITIAGIFDWEQVLKAQKSVQYEDAAYGIFLRNLGDPQLDREQFDAISPLRHVDKVKIPVFVAHGRDDKVADVREARALIAGLEKFQVPYESLLVAREGHGMRFTKNQVELYSRIEAFLARNLAPAK